MSQDLKSAAFQKELEKFKREHKNNQQWRQFKETSVEDLKKYIITLQSGQHGIRRIQNLKKLGPFLEAMEQYGKVVEIFCNSNNFVPFIWGPLKFLLTIATSCRNAFNALLDAYKDIGDKLPLLVQYEDLFRHKPHMGELLVNIYQDIIKFHCTALNCFNQRHWRTLFQALWPVKKMEVSEIVSRIGKTATKIIQHANAAEIEDFQIERRLAESRFNETRENEKNERRQKVAHWIRAPTIEGIHKKIFETRIDYPDTGKWIFGVDSFKDWFDLDDAHVPPLLWMNGSPGSGKTILASMIIEETKQLQPAPIALFFYCKHDNPEYDNFDSLARSFLTQMLGQRDETFLELIYEERCKSNEVFASPVKVRELLKEAFKHCTTTYIIIDGLDECKREERKRISKYFQNLIEKLVDNPRRIRCLFISRHDGDGRRDFEDIETLEVRSTDIQGDIEYYCQCQANRFPPEFQLSESSKKYIAKKVSTKADGMFLLARLIWHNLFTQRSPASLKRVLESKELPIDLNDAYRRIISNYKKDSAGNNIPRIPIDIHQLLQWLVLSKRALKWREIQVLKSISHQDEESFIDRKEAFWGHVKDICGPLVNFNSEDNGDDEGTVELIHLTAKKFLIDEGIVDTLKHDIMMTCRCLNYLNLPIFSSGISRDAAQEGDYGLMEYAVVNWVKHLEGVLAEASRRLKRGKDKERDPGDDVEENDRIIAYPVLREPEFHSLIRELAEPLGLFVDHHWNPPARNLEISRRNTEKLRVFREDTFYDQLEQIYVSTRQQLHTYNSVKKEPLASSIADTVLEIRTEIEEAFSDASDKNAIFKSYGRDIFKCPRLSCKSFTSGFKTAEDRDRHKNRHYTPFPCENPDCPMFEIGFDSPAKVKKHMSNAHPDTLNDDHTFPTDLEIRESVRSLETERQRSILREPQVPEDSPAISKTPENEMNHEDATPESQGTLATETESTGPEIPEEPEIRPPPLPQSQPHDDLKCPRCSREFTRRYNLKSHLLTHRSERPFECQVCSRAFARKGDHARHMKIHSGEKNFICDGCQSRFIRSHELTSHHRSQRGQICLQRMEQERFTHQQ